MRHVFDYIRRRLILKINLPIAVVLILGTSLWASFHLSFQERIVTENIIQHAERLSNTIRLGLHYAMMLNSRDDIKMIVNNYSRLGEIRGVRIIDKYSVVMFSSHASEVGTEIDQSSGICQVCHTTSPAILYPTQEQSIYQQAVVNGERVMRMVSPIPNDPGCSGPPCHYHRPDEPILGVLDIAFSLEQTDVLARDSRKNTIVLAVLLFVSIFATLFVLFFVLIKRPLSKIVQGAGQLAEGVKIERDMVEQPDEIGQLSRAIFEMGNDLVDKQDQLRIQRNQYQNLFEGVPCLITVQNEDLQLLSFNKTFEENFSAHVGEYCYKAYKNRDDPCPSCPVLKTISDGKSHVTEETGYYKDGRKAHWIVTTSPIYDTEGNVVAAMEMCLDITSRKELEEEVRRSEKKYCDIFNNVPNSLFVIDADDYSILDCNRSALSLYEYTKSELLGMSFLHLCVDDGSNSCIRAVQAGDIINQSKHITKPGREFYVSIHSSPSEFAGRKVWLVSIMDITKRLEIEQHLIQASKMATLGEMATGVAHELNQPLAVIQTSMDLLKRKIVRGDPVPAEDIGKIAELASGSVDRATKIIGHMRAFGRLSDIQMERVNINDVLNRAFEFFKQQLTLRNIVVEWDEDEKLPLVLCEPNRMEQVFINFLLNARDAIEEKAQKSGGEIERRITIKTMHNHEFVTVRISDTGTGVPQSIRDRIFEPFFTTKQVGKGTGLGLSISYGIVRDCGGTINVTNNDSGGASFFIRLPVAPLK